MTIKKKAVRINEAIDTPSIRLIDAEGQQVGVVSTAEALQKAEDSGLDLVELSPNAKLNVLFRGIDHTHPYFDGRDPDYFQNFDF